MSATCFRGGIAGSFEQNGATSGSGAPLSLRGALTHRCCRQLNNHNMVVRRRRFSNKSILEPDSIGRI